MPIDHQTLLESTYKVDSRGLITVHDRSNKDITSQLTIEQLEAVKETLMRQVQEAKWRPKK